MGDGAPGLTLGYAVKLAEGAPRLRPGKRVSFASINVVPGRATIQFLPVGGDLAQGVHLKTVSATPNVVVMLLLFCPTPAQFDSE